MSNKIKITFVVPSKLQQDLSIRVSADGYGMRGKSRWVVEAIDYFLELPNYVDMVLLGDEMSGMEKVESVYVDRETKLLLEKAIIEVRTANPAIEGVQSRIIRTSIIQRLLRS